MAKKSKKSNGLVLVGTMVSPAMVEALRLLAEEENRSVSKTVKKVLEDSPFVQAALRKVQSIKAA